MKKEWERALVLCERVNMGALAIKFAVICDTNHLHGLAFQHLAICRRRAWLHMHRIDYAHLEDRMARGTLSHVLNKVRDKSVEGLIGLAPDRIDWKQYIVVEAKGKRGATAAVSRQTMFYALMLHARTGFSWRPAIEIISERRTDEVQMSIEDARNMLEMALDLASLRRSTCPEGIDEPICRTCSYKYLCGRF